jgi:peptide/nickel transport system substrate-binding protein/oligopeptide transport system substrate-binding protein
MCLALIFSACKSSPSPEESVPETPEQTNSDFAETRPWTVVRDELTTAFSSGDVELDFRASYLASEAQIFTALYEGLFSYHPFTMEPVPGVAEKWDVSEDKKQWTFTIRAGAKYWNGDDLRAEDFRASWLSLMDPKRNSPYSSLFDVIEGAREYRTGVLTDSAKVGISAPDTKILVVRLSAPASFFPAMLCHHSFSPIHPSMINREKWVSPVSNGPFQLTENTQEKMILLKNENYWDASRVSLKKITIRFTETPSEAAKLWNSGEARWISGDVDLGALTDLSGTKVNAMFATHYWFIRSAEKPWDDYRLRRALSIALPWDEIRSRYLLPAKTLIYPISGYPEIEGIGEADVDTAKKLLDDAGYPDGTGLPTLVIRLTPSEEAARIGGIMANTWKEQLGLSVRVEVIPFNRYFQALKGSGYSVGFSTWIGDFADPYTFLQMWQRDSNLNDARYNDDDYESLMEKSMTEDGAERWATLAEAEKMLLDRGVVLPISHNPAVNIVDTSEIDGWYQNALDIHPFKYLSFKAFRPLPGVVMVK